MRSTRRHIATTIRAAALTAALVVVSCIDEKYEGPDPDAPRRTVLFYLAGDNNLAELGRIPELLRAAWTYTGNRCLIYYDAPAAQPVLLSLRGGCAVTPTPYIETIAQYPEENSASAEVFARVVEDMARIYPSESYGLVFVSHASGWLPQGALADPQAAAGVSGAASGVGASGVSAAATGGASRSIGSDTTPGTMAGGSAEMELADFAAAIPDHRFDFILFEACLMAGVEVAYELRDKTDYIVASSAEMLSPGFVPVYEQGASRLLFDTTVPVGQALTEFATRYFDYMNARSGAYRSATVSILKTAEMESLAALAADIYTENAFDEVSDMTDLQHFDRPGSYGDYPARARYFDLEDYFERLAPDPNNARTAAALGKAVVWKAATPEFMTGYNGFAVNRHSGLTTYIEQVEFPQLNDAYRRTAWYGATRKNNSNFKHRQ